MQSNWDVVYGKDTTRFCYSYEQYEWNFVHLWETEVKAELNISLLLGKMTVWEYLVTWPHRPVCGCADCLFTDLVGHRRRWWRRTAGPGLWRSFLPLLWCRWWERWARWLCTLRWHSVGSGWLWCSSGCTPPTKSCNLKSGRDGSCQQQAVNPLRENPTAVFFFFFFFFYDSDSQLACETGQANRNIKLTSSKIESACDYTSPHAHTSSSPLASTHTHTHTHTHAYPLKVNAICSLASSSFHVIA